MRRVLIAVLLTTAFAPATFAAPLTLGVHGGSSIPNLRDNGGNELSSGWSSRVGLCFGVTADWALSPAWSVQPELNWVGQGGKRDGMQPLGDGTYASFKHESRLDYLELPVLARWHFGGLHRLSLAAGPYVGWLVSAKEVTSGTSLIYADRAGTTPVFGPVPFDATTDIKDSVHPFNWGVQAGVGAEQPLGRGALTFDVRGGIGLTNIQKDAAADGKNSTGALVVTLGWAVPIGAAR